MLSKSAPHTGLHQVVAGGVLHAAIFGFVCVFYLVLPTPLAAHITHPDTIMVLAVTIKQTEPAGSGGKVHARIRTPVLTTPPLFLFFFRACAKLIGGDLVPG